MSDLPGQKFRYGFAIEKEEFFDAKLYDRSRELNDWYRDSEIDTRENASAINGTLVFSAGATHRGEYTGAIIGVPILADECLGPDEGYNRLGRYQVGEFDVVEFNERVAEAREIWEEHPEIKERILDVLGEYIEDEEQSVVTASGMI